MKNGFIITIGRQFGSGGREIGSLVAAEMGVDLYDRKLITEAAKSSGLSDELLRQMDERTPGTWRHALSPGFGFGGFSAESLFAIQSEAIKLIASKGSCVIVGRGADYVLRDYPNCYNVFIHSSEEDRVRRVMSRKGTDEKEALDIIRKIDKSRAAYYNFYTGKIWGNSASYHLSVDSSVLGIEESGKLIRDFVRAAVEKSPL